MGTGVMKVLTSAEVERLRKEVLKILEEVGVRVCHEEAKELLHKAGAKVDFESDLVKVPVSLSERCLESLPRQTMYGGRNPEDDVIVPVAEGEPPHPRSLSGAEDYVDLKTGQKRDVIYSDMKDWSVLQDALDNIHIQAPPYYADSGMNLNARDVHAVAALMETSPMPILIQLYGPENLQYCIDMAVVERGSEEALRKRPRFVIHVAPVSPLTWHANSVDQLLLAGKYGIPVEIDTNPFGGLSAPVTLAGGILMPAAEYLSSIVITQTANPGAPLIEAARLHFLEMVSGHPLLGSVETNIASVAMIQLAKEGFNWIINTLPATDSHLPDMQAVLEMAVAIFSQGCGGGDVISGGGHFDALNALDPALLVIHNDIYGMVFRAKKGIEVNDDNIAFDLIKKIGSGTRGNYLSERHTLEHFRSELSIPGIMTRMSMASWESAGSKDLYQMAKEKAAAILNDHKPEALDKTVVQKLKPIVEKAEKEIKGSTTT